MKKEENMYNNPLSRKWKQRYEEQSEETKKKLDELEQKDFKEYQLKIIKRKKTYPRKGDVFLIEPVEGIFFWGIVINNHICNINGEDLLVVMIFKERVYDTKHCKWQVNTRNLLIEPCIVGKEYWTKGFFYTVDNIIVEKKELSYGFYCIFENKYYDEWGKELEYVPDLIGTYGVLTISGIAYKINVELIIDKTLLSDE